MPLVGSLIVFHDSTKITNQTHRNKFKDLPRTRQLKRRVPFFLLRLWLPQIPSCCWSERMGTWCFHPREPWTLTYWSQRKALQYIIDKQELAFSGPTEKEDQNFSFVRQAGGQVSSCFRQGELGRHQITTKRLIEARFCFLEPDLSLAEWVTLPALVSTHTPQFSLSPDPIWIEGNWSNFG